MTGLQQSSFAEPDGNFDDSDEDKGVNNLLVYGGGEGGNTRYVFTVDQDGTYFLKVGGRLFGVSSESSSYRAGTFKVSVREVTWRPQPRPRERAAGSAAGPGNKKGRTHGQAGEAAAARCGLFPRQPGRKQ